MSKRMLVMFLIGLTGLTATAPNAAGAVSASSTAYPYRSAAFTQFLNDSYQEAPSAGVTPFYAWFEQAYAASPARLAGAGGLTDAVAARARAIAAAREPASKAREQLATAVWLYRIIKATIPRLSLSRGYEFVYTVRYGERQCLLQSVLIAGLLQAAGVDAGVHMVWKNMTGQESNNGHAVTVVSLADGKDVEIDASEHEPIATHQGLFAVDRRTGDYLFVEPRFDRDGLIIAYESAAGGTPLSPRSLQGLGIAFLRSQFYYYRGEQVSGGLVNGPATEAGLRTAARYLEAAERYDPRNPLAVYMLGRVYLRLGQTAAAKERLIRGYRLYLLFGHVPEGPKAAYALTRSL